MGCSSSKTVPLKDEDLKFLIRNTNYDEKTIKEWYQGFIQDCPTGKLSRHKFLQMYQMFFTTGNPEQFCDHVYRTFDADGNGHIDFKEFLLAVGVTTSGTSQEKLKWAFRMYDINGDGQIHRQEMTKIVQALYDMLGPTVEMKPDDTPIERTRLIFERMDTNKDDRLSQDEFVQGCLEDPQLAHLLTASLSSKEATVPMPVEDLES